MQPGPEWEPRSAQAWAAAVPHGFESKSKDAVNVIEVYETGEQGDICEDAAFLCEVVLSS